MDAMRRARDRGGLDVRLARRKDVGEVAAILERDGVLEVVARAVGASGFSLPDAFRRGPGSKDEGRAEARRVAYLALSRLGWSASRISRAFGRYPVTIKRALAERKKPPPLPGPGPGGIFVAAKDEADFARLRKIAEAVEGGDAVSYVESARAMASIVLSLFPEQATARWWEEPAAASSGPEGDE